jgi:GntR family transcriptional regulator
LSAYGELNQRPLRRHRPAGKNTERWTTVRWVCDLMLAELMAGTFPNGVLPSEDALIRKYSVTRGVIRQVLLVLQEQGMIERVRGAGTFVVAPSILLHGIDESRDLAQEVNAKGTRAVIRVAHIDLHPATEFIADMLQIAAGDDVVILETFTHLDGFPLSMRTAFMPASRFGMLMTDSSIDLGRSPYEIFAEVLSEPIGETQLWIGSSTANRLLADALDIQPGNALLDTTRVIRDRTGVPLEYSISHARADRLIFSTVMRAAPTEERLGGSGELGQRTEGSDAGLSDQQNAGGNQ